VAAALDMGTATCAAVNSAYFIDRLLACVDRIRSRRLAVGALALVSVASLTEALGLLAIAAGPRESMALTSAPWAIVQTLPFAGAAAISALIARRTVLR